MAKTLLLADDSITIQRVVGITFANEDFEITTVDNGEDAILKAKELRPDIVLADVIMPKRNGYEVCKAIKSDPDLGRTPVLLLAGTFEAFDENRAREVGANGHITKPFESQALIDKVKEMLGAPAGPPQPVAVPRPVAQPTTAQVRPIPVAVPTPRPISPVPPPAAVPPTFGGMPPMQPRPIAPMASTPMPPPVAVTPRPYVPPQPLTPAAPSPTVRPVAPAPVSAAPFTQPPVPPAPKPIEPRPFVPRPIEPKPIQPKPIETPRPIPRPLEPKPFEPKPVPPPAMHSPFEMEPIEGSPLEPEPLGAQSLEAETFGQSPAFQPEPRPQPFEVPRAPIAAAGFGPLGFEDQARGPSEAEPLEPATPEPLAEEVPEADLATPSEGTGPAFDLGGFGSEPPPRPESFETKPGTLADLTEESRPVPAEEAVDLPSVDIDEEGMSDQPPALAPMHEFIPKPETVGHPAARLAERPMVSLEPERPASKPAPVFAASAPAEPALSKEELRAIARETIEKVVWDIVPQLAESILREEIEKLVQKKLSD